MSDMHIIDALVAETWRYLLTFLLNIQHEYQIFSDGELDRSQDEHVEVNISAYFLPSSVD